MSGGPGDREEESPCTGQARGDIQAWESEGNPSGLPREGAGVERKPPSAMGGLEEPETPRQRHLKM